MNYRHSFHAGNFADVLKHVVLARILDYLKRKDKAFRVIDTHAGAGIYDLAGSDAGRTGEWKDGIGRLEAASLGARSATLLFPYLEAVAAARRTGADLYPGSPWITRHLLRKQDRLSAIELHPQEAERLRTLFAGDFQVKAIELDGWLALGAHLPPKEKRGLVLVDPPFERDGEFDRLLEGAERAYKRWETGILALWYPVKNDDDVARFREGMASSGIAKVLDIELLVRAQTSPPRLIGSGMTIVNPPFGLDLEMEELLPELTNLLQMDDAAQYSVKWMARPAGDA